MNNDKIFVVIPVINLWDAYTIHCMESIAASQCSVPFEVVIVDQCSTDMTVEKANDFGNRKMPGRVHVIHNDKNTGCAGGWNQGTAFAIEHGASHIVLLNNDTLVGPGALEGMYKRMKRDPHVFLCSCVDVIKELPVAQMILKPEHEINHKAESEAPHPNFSCFMITPETVEKVGWFDEEFFPAYFEDNDYHYRCKVVGGTDSAIATTTAVFVHYGSRTQNQEAGRPVVPGPKFQNNAEYFHKKWGGIPGGEQFRNAFNDESKGITYAKRTA